MIETRRWSDGDCIPTGTVGTRSGPAGRGRQDTGAPRVAETMTKARLQLLMRAFGTMVRSQSACWEIFAIV
jgi:hypothetical protein